MATAYTILYGNEKAGLGPGVDDDVSFAAVFDGVDVAGSPSTTVGGGGGSMTDGAGDGPFDRGSGSEGIGSSADEVSIVICFVGGGDCRRV